MPFAKLKATASTPPGRRTLVDRFMVALPDVGRPWRMAALAALVMVAMGVFLGHLYWDQISETLGDTDDATRLVAVRALVAGQGWWDLHMMRFQPPVGVYMHWSRLLDGAIAAMDDAFRLVLNGDDAELATRFLFPLLWIFPAALAALVQARRLGMGLLNNAAVAVAAVILVTDVYLYVQFHPGRIDHHDVQMTCAILALAGASVRHRRFEGAILAGLATALGTAIGLEGLVFSAIVGAGVALRFAFDRTAARTACAYGLSLASGTALLYAIQTPPWRWALAVCDALAVNLVVAMVVAGLGLALIASRLAARRWTFRLGALLGLGAVSAAVYFGLYRNCIHGFFADVDPRIRPIWLNYVQEVRPITLVLKKNLADGAERIAPWVVGVLSWIILGLRRERRRDFAFWLCGACLAAAVAAGAAAIRMSGYAEWFAVPVIAGASVEVLAWAGYRNGLAVLLAAMVASPMTASGLADEGAKAVAPFLAKRTPGGKVAARPAHKAEPGGADPCTDTDSYDVLAEAKPAGEVLSDVDLGPFILASTNDTALAGPYHRLSWGVLRAHAILKAPADGASETLARRQGIAYVLECQGHRKHGDRADMAANALQKRLDAGKPPAWLQPLSDKGEPLQVYRVRPASAPAPTPAPEPAPTHGATPKPEASSQVAQSPIGVVPR